MLGSLHFTFGRTMDDILTNTQELALAWNAEALRGSVFLVSLAGD